MQQAMRVQQNLLGPPASRVGPDRTQERRPLSTYGMDRHVLLMAWIRNIC